jgi:energy-coupling factor transporter ATP-binding protein EcfA2
MFEKWVAAFRGWRASTYPATIDAEVAAAEKAYRLKKLSTDSANLDVEKAYRLKKLSTDSANLDVEKEYRLKKLSTDSANLDVEANAKKAEANAAAERALAAKADTAAANSRAIAAKAEASLALAEVRKRKTWYLLPVVAGFGLLVDWWYHDCESGIKWRMKRKLRHCPVPATAVNAPAEELPTLQEPFTKGMKPLMILGPTGSGKSTLLAKLARESASPPPGSGKHATPTVLIRLRLPLVKDATTTSGTGLGPDAVAASTTGLAAVRQLNAIAAEIYEQISFPGRRSLLTTVMHMLLRDENTTYSNDHSSFFFRGIPLGSARTVSRLQEALGMLYRTCQELQVEREKAGLSNVDASCVILIDEAQDLIKDTRLAAAGGREVFADIGTLAVAFGVDRKAVRTVVAGSSAFLALEFEGAGIPTGSRWNTFTLADPDPLAVRSQLMKRGYSSEEAERMLIMCGPRMRLLEEPLQGVNRPTIHQWSQGMERMAMRAFSSVFAGLPEEERGSFVALLEEVARGSPSGVGVPIERMGRMQAQWTRNSDITKVLYLDDSFGLHFQSQLHCAVWPAVVHKYKQFKDARDVPLEQPKLK